MLTVAILTMGTSMSFGRARPTISVATDKGWPGDSRTLFDFTVKDWKGSIIFLYSVYLGWFSYGRFSGESVALNSYRGKKAFLVVNVASN